MNNTGSSDSIKTKMEEIKTDTVLDTNTNTKTKYKIKKLKSQNYKFIEIKNIYLDYYAYSAYNFTLHEFVKKEFPEHNNFFVISEGKLIPLHTELNDLFSCEKVNRFEIFEKQKGGGLIDMFMSIIYIGKFFILIGDFIIWFGKFLYWFFFFIAWVFTDFLNPIKLATEFYKSLLVILSAICKFPFDLLQSLFALVINNLADWMQGFWGWDQTNLTQSDKDSNYFKSIDRNKGKKCYVTDGNTVPFSVILGTLLCPPLGVFMDMGATGWLNIVICALLTLLFYLPGLCYALLVIYS
jgi:uncharacterized membrane protein YqaE (UPF0057 family)